MKVIRDPIHGYIELDDFALSLLDTSEMQRLRRVHQLGFSNLVYPGANHTRFEHSLGVYHLASRLINQVDESHRSELLAAGLLHDIGHGPLSHVTEELIKRYTRQGHDYVEDILGKGEVGEVLENYSFKPSLIAKHIRGITSLGQILNSEIDIDRMDYLVRDSHYTGVAFGLIDHVRLLHELRFYEGKLVVEAGGLQAAESLLVSRFLMHPTVYYHHVGRIAETMATHAAEKVIEASMSPQRLRRMDDSEFMDALRTSGGYPGEIADRLRNRRLFKRALYTGLDSINQDQVFRYRKNIGRVEMEIAEEAGIEPGYVLVDIPPRPKITEIKAKIMINNKLVPLDEASHLVAILGRAQEDSWRMGVYVPGEHREAVGRIAREFFNVKRETKQFRFSEL